MIFAVVETIAYDPCFAYRHNCYLRPYRDIAADQIILLEHRERSGFEERSRHLDTRNQQRKPGTGAGHRYMAQLVPPCR